MDEIYPKDRTHDIFSRNIKSGRRTYFFDVKTAPNEKLYIAVTESKKRFDTLTGKYAFEKHKIFLYQEDFEMFANCLSDVIEFIQTNSKSPAGNEDLLEEEKVDLSFEDLSFIS